MTVASLLASCSSREIGEWYAYFHLCAEERQGNELATKAETGLKTVKARRRPRRR